MKIAEDNTLLGYVQVYMKFEPAKAANDEKDFQPLYCCINTDFSIAPTKENLCSFQQKTVESCEKIAGYEVVGSFVTKEEYQKGSADYEEEIIAINDSDDSNDE